VKAALSNGADPNLEENLVMPSTDNVGLASCLSFGVCMCVCLYVCLYVCLLRQIVQIMCFFFFSFSLFIQSSGTRQECTLVA